MANIALDPFDIYSRESNQHYLSDFLRALSHAELNRLAGQLIGVAGRDPVIKVDVASSTVVERAVGAAEALGAELNTLIGIVGRDGLYCAIWCNEGARESNMPVLAPQLRAVAGAYCVFAIALSPGPAHAR